MTLQLNSLIYIGETNEQISSILVENSIYEQNYFVKGIELQKNTIISIISSTFNDIDFGTENRGNVASFSLLSGIQAEGGH